MNFLASFKSQNTVFDPGFGNSVKICPRMRSPYAILLLFLVENVKMPISELELAENTLFFEDFGLQNTVFDPGF